MIKSKYLYYGIANGSAQVRGEELVKQLEMRRIKLSELNDRERKVYNIGYRTGIIDALYTEGYGYSEIAEKLGIPESSVRSLITAAAEVKK